MCAVIGVYLERPTSKQIDTVKKLFIESQIRGRHQTGLTANINGDLYSYIRDGAADEFVKSFLDWGTLQDQKILRLIGHCRYSTSDLRYPQPIRIERDFAIVHNGVVTQDPPETWHRYGYDLETCNDSELIYHCSKSGKEPLLEFPDASMAVCELSDIGGLSWYRNAKRPLYQVQVDNGWFVCSTKDIAVRAGLKKAERCKPGFVYTPNGYARISNVEEMIP